jgi:NADH-quinone oxidoreductase subunit L
LVGIVLGWFVYGRKPRQNALDDDPLALTSPAVFTLLNRKWYVDELYEVTIIWITGACAVFFRLVDKLVVDGILHALVWGAWGLSQLFRWGGDEFVINDGFDASCESVRLGGKVLARLQSGRVQNYFRVLSLGTAILLLIYFFA